MGQKCLQTSRPSLYSEQGASRQKPESARSTILVSGQHRRICCTMRLISSTAPAAASRLASRSRAHSNWSPAKIVQRQIAVVGVVAVEEALRLVPVERDVGGIQIEHDLSGWLRCDSR
jgi:hypothetical protein